MFTELCNHHHYLIPGHFHHSRKKPQAVSSHLLLSPPSNLWQPLAYFLSPWSSLFQTFCINGIIYHVALCNWLLSLSMMFSRFIPYCSVNRCTFLFLWPNNSPLEEYTTFCLSIHQLMGIWIVSTFWLLMNSIMDTYICV